MPRYYFHVRDELFVDDEEGLELSGPEAARETALEAARDMVCASIRQGYLNFDHQIEVASEDGEILFKISYREAFAIEGGP